MPRAGEVRRVERLKRHVPTAVATFDDVDQPRVISLVAVVVGGEQVAELIEGNLLRIAQAAMHNLELRAVGIAAKHRSVARAVKRDSFLRGDMEAAIADREIQLAVRSPNQAVQVVSEKRRVHAEAGQQFLLDVSHAVAVGVSQSPEMRDASEVDVSVVSQDSRCQSRERFVEAGREDAALIGSAVAVGVGNESHLVGDFREPTHPAVEAISELLKHRQTIFGCLNSQIVFEQERSSPIFFSAAVESVLLGNEDTILFVDCDRDGTRQLRLGSEEFDFQSVGDSQRRDLFDGGDCAIGQVGINQRRCSQGHPSHQQRNRNAQEDRRCSHRRVLSKRVIEAGDLFGGE